MKICAKIFNVNICIYKIFQSINVNDLKQADMLELAKLFS